MGPGILSSLQIKRRPARDRDEGVGGNDANIKKDGRGDDFQPVTSQKYNPKVLRLRIKNERIVRIGAHDWPAEGVTRLFGNERADTKTERHEDTRSTPKKSVWIGQETASGKSKAPTRRRNTKQKHPHKGNTKKQGRREFGDWSIHRSP